MSTVTTVSARVVLVAAPAVVPLPVALNATVVQPLPTSATVESKGEASPAPTAKTLDPVEQIRKLKSLADAGGITQEEFEQRKAQLLKAL